MGDDLDIPAGSATSSLPIDGGVVVLNGAVPPGHDDHEVWRTLTNAEVADQADRTRQFAVSSAQARRAMLRIERNRRLAATDWTELPSARARFDAPTQAAWASYRQALRDLTVAAVDPDNPPWPTPPGPVGEAGDNGGAASLAAPS